MSTDVRQLKKSVRQQVQAVLRELSPQDRRASSELICLRLQQQPIWERAGRVLLFAPLPDEPDIWSLVGRALQAGKMVALPRYEPSSGRYEAGRVQRLGQDLAVGHYGIREPPREWGTWPLNQLDLVLVPGVAFAIDGRRLGRGRGYYDRLLSLVGGIKCGVAFDQQMDDRIPVEPHDDYLDCILTPSRWLPCSSRAVLK